MSLNLILSRLCFFEKCLNIATNSNINAKIQIKQMKNAFFIYRFNHANIKNVSVIEIINVSIIIANLVFIIHQLLTLISCFINRF